MQLMSQATQWPKRLRPSAKCHERMSKTRTCKKIGCYFETTTHKSTTRAVMNYNYTF